MSKEEYISLENFNLKEYNTFSVSTVAENAYMPYSCEGVAHLLSEVGEECVFLGKGSNTIFSNRKCIRPVIISELMKNIYYDGKYIIAECGVSLSRLSWFALEHSLSGYEYLEDIPGSVGGALYMNAGTYEDSIGKQVHSVMIYDNEDKTVKELSKDDLSCFWGKRKSYFQVHNCYIIQCCLETNHQDNYNAILDRMLSIKKKRYLKQPRDYPNAGSVFKRPYIDNEPKYVWKLLEEAGLRGCRIGDAQVSEKHPGFIINVGHATGDEIVALMNHCKDVVYKKYGICLEEEWKIV